MKFFNHSHSLLKTFFVFFALNIALCFEALPHHSKDDQQANQGVFASIVAENQKTLCLDGEEKNRSKEHKEKREKGLIARLQRAYENKCNPSSNARRRLMFNLLTEYEREHPQTSSNVLDIVTWQDLELLNGPKTDPRLYLAHVLDRTITESGRMMFYKKIVTPTPNIEQLINQQTVVKKFVADSELFAEIDKRLRALVIPENVVLSFWDSNDQFSRELEDFQIQFDFNLQKTNLFSFVKENLDKSPLAMEANHIYDKFMESIGLVTKGTSVPSLLLYALFGDSTNIPCLAAGEKLNKMGFLSPLGLFWNFLTMVGLSPHITCLIALYAAASALYKNITKGFTTESFIREKLHASICHVATYITSLREIGDLLEKKPVLRNKIPQVTRFKEKLNRLQEKNADLMLLFDLLQKDTFKQPYSDIFSNVGNVVVAYALMLDLKNHFVDAMLAVGEIDAQLSIAKLYKEFEQKMVKFCYPTFIQGRSTPCIKAINFWHPALDPKNAIPSSLQVGTLFGDQDIFPQSAIITGPNAGGKSTVTKAYVIAMILAQSLGIAPADELLFTPFEYIGTYLNITDNMARGNSHFKAGVARARDILKAVQLLPEGKFCLTAVDEVFNGTTFEEGQAAAFAFIEQLGNNKRTVCITNTHFPLIPLLEQTGRFRNYSVTVNEGDDGQLEYPFTLVRGVAHQIITFKILQNEGMGDQFLRRAQEILAITHGGNATRDSDAERTLALLTASTPCIPETAEVFCQVPDFNQVKSIPEQATELLSKEELTKTDDTSYLASLLCAQ